MGSLERVAGVVAFPALDRLSVVVGLASSEDIELGLHRGSDDAIGSLVAVLPFPKQGPIAVVDDLQVEIGFRFVAQHEIPRVRRHHVGQGMPNRLLDCLLLLPQRQSVGDDDDLLEETQVLLFQNVAPSVAEEWCVRRKLEEVILGWETLPIFQILLSSLQVRLSSTEISRW